MLWYMYRRSIFSNIKININRYAVTWETFSVCIFFSMGLDRVYSTFSGVLQVLDAFYRVLIM